MPQRQQKQFLTTSSGSHGVDIYFKRKSGLVVISGWYDKIVGMGSEQISLREFLSVCGITLEDCQRAFAKNRKEKVNES
jgi:hypothetical protein